MHALEIVRNIATAVAALIALAAFVLSWRALSTTANVARAQLYLELRKRFVEINDQLPREIEKDYHTPQWHPTLKEDPTDFSKLEKYWYHAFDEWFTIKMLHPRGFHKLWTLFFERAVFEGLKNVPIRYVLYRMVEDNRTSFSGRRKEFVQDLTAVYKKYAKKGIFDGFKEYDAQRAVGSTPTTR